MCLTLLITSVPLPKQLEVYEVELLIPTKISTCILHIISTKSRAPSVVIGNLLMARMCQMHLFIS